MRTIDVRPPLVQTKRWFCFSSNGFLFAYSMHVNSLCSAYLSRPHAFVLRNPTALIRKATTKYILFCVPLGNEPKGFCRSFACSFEFQILWNAVMCDIT